MSTTPERPTFLLPSSSRGRAAPVNDPQVSESDSDHESLVQVQFKALMQNVRKLEDNLKLMRKQNLQLQQKLDDYEDDTPITPRRTSANIETNAKIRNLEARVGELEKRNSRLNKKVKQLRDKEIQAEADELIPECSDDETHDRDRFQRMRKLLRRFAKWMSITTLAEDPEDCPVCLDQLKKKKAYAIPCEHLICIECLPQISKGADETVTCPQCRRVFPREEVGLLQYTETERWDELLKLAGDSTYIDYGGGETSSEQEEEEFIDDGESRTVSSEGGVTEDQSEDGRENEGVLNGNRPPSMPPGGPVSYKESPTREKRKKMEELALTRSKRQRVL